MLIVLVVLDVLVLVELGPSVDEVPPMVVVVVDFVAVYARRTFAFFALKTPVIVRQVASIRPLIDTFPRMPSQASHLTLKRVPLFVALSRIGVASVHPLSTPICSP